MDVTVWMLVDEKVASLVVAWAAVRVSWMVDLMVALSVVGKVDWKDA